MLRWNLDSFRLVARTAEESATTKPVDGLSLIFTDLDRSKVGNHETVTSCYIAERVLGLPKSY